MPRLKPKTLPVEFLMLNDELTDLKQKYTATVARYRAEVEMLAAQGFRAGHIYGVSPIAYPTLRKWMQEAEENVKSDPELQTALF